jgi:hypothetical protein
MTASTVSCFLGTGGTAFEMCSDPRDSAPHADRLSGRHRRRTLPPRDPHRELRSSDLQCREQYEYEGGRGNQTVNGHERNREVLFGRCRVFGCRTRAASRECWRRLAALKPQRQHPEAETGHDEQDPEGDQARPRLSIAR